MDSPLNRFLRKKMSEWFENAKKTEAPLLKDVLSDIRQGNNLYGFIFEKEKKMYDDEVSYTYTKSEEEITIDCGIYNAKKSRWTTRPFISLQIGNVSSAYYIDNHPNFVYQVFEHSGEIEKEFIEISAQLDKDNKIKDISQKSIETWIKALFKENPYPYYTQASEYKITLSVKMKNGIQLDIPIYYKKFQQIMQQIMPTIVEYENLIEKNNVKVLILNLKKNCNWINNK